MKIDQMGSLPDRLPITHDLTPAYVLSLTVALIMAVASAAGLLYQTVIYPTNELLLSFTSSDMFNLAATEIPSWIADFMVPIPMLLVNGILLWRRKALGYVAGTGLLLGYGVLALGVIPFFVVQARYVASPIDVTGIVAILVMAALCFIPFAFFVRGAASDRSSSPIG
jgi:hypothetical protein